MSDSSRVYLAARAESSFNETPGATPRLLKIPVTGISLKDAKTTVENDDIDEGRNVGASTMVGLDVTGGFAFNFRYGNYDGFIEAALGGTWASNVLKNGVARRSFFFEEKFGDITQFRTFRGCTPAGWKLKIDSRKNVTGEFTFMGTRGATSTTTVATVTDPAPVAPIIQAGVRVGTVLIDGVASGYKIKSLDLELENGPRLQDHIESIYSDQHGLGDCRVKGKISIYLKDMVLHEKMRSHTPIALTIPLGDAVSPSGQYAILLPRVLLSDSDPGVSGKATDVMQTLDFMAEYDPTEACTIKITRTPGV